MEYRKEIRWSTGLVIGCGLVWFGFGIVEVMGAAHAMRVMPPGLHVFVLSLLGTGTVGVVVDRVGLRKLRHLEELTANQRQIRAGQLLILDELKERTAPIPPQAHRIIRGVATVVRSSSMEMATTAEMARPDHDLDPRTIKVIRDLNDRLGG